MQVTASGGEPGGIDDKTWYTWLVLIQPYVQFTFKLIQAFRFYTSDHVVPRPQYTLESIINELLCEALKRSYILESCVKGPPTVLPHSLYRHGFDRRYIAIFSYREVNVHGPDVNRDTQNKKFGAFQSCAR